MNSSRDINLLNEFHSKFAGLPVIFRESVCTECDWSIPTFYRKIRIGNTETSQNSKKATFSNAEHDKIISVYEDMLNNLQRISKL